MPFIPRSVALLVACCAWAMPAHAEIAADTTELVNCGLLQIHELGFDAVQDAQSTPGLVTWAELDDTLFACGSVATLQMLEDRVGAAMAPMWTDIDPDHLFVLHSAHPGKWPEIRVERLASAGPWAVLVARQAETREKLLRGEISDVHNHGEAAASRVGIQPLAQGRVLARQAANLELKRRGAFSPAVAAAVATLDADRWFADLTTLAGWNRHIRSSEIDVARDWLLQEMNALDLESVRSESFFVGGTEAYNVVGELRGTVRPEELLIVGGHYDSTSQDVDSAAPGAEDNASGCAGVLALARALSQFSTEATIRFTCFSGEEQGLFGSRYQADQLVTEGLDDRVTLMLNMDMIGYTSDADLDCLIETDQAFPNLPDDFVAAAAEFTTLRTVVSFFAFGSDHVPFLDLGMPGLLTIQNDWASYPGYHSTTDVPGNVVIDMGRETLRMNAAVLAHRAGIVDPALLFSNGFESGSLTAWDASSR